MDVLMNEAIEEAKKGLQEGGIPIGSVLVKDGKVIGRGHNMRVQENDPMGLKSSNWTLNTARI